MIFEYLIEKYCVSESYPKLITYPEIDSDIYKNLVRLDSQMKFINIQIKITSGYRNERLNRAVGGSPTSKHLLGLAVDFIPAKKFTPIENLFNWCRDNLDYDKLLLENKQWIHLQIAADITENRHIALLTDKKGRAV